MYLLACLALCLSAAPPATVAPPESGQVARSADPVSPGEAVTLRWYFTGTKVMVSGGRFGHGAVVTGRSSITDRPRSTTAYTFDVWYRPAGQKTLLHQRYSTVVDVMPVSAYRDTSGWTIRYPSGWKHDTAAMQQNDSVTYFQQEDDSVERIAVAVMPASDGSCSDLMDRIKQDAPSHYEQVQFDVDQETTQHTYPAHLASFTGHDSTHQGMPTRSIVLALIRDGKAYVVSARTRASQPGRAHVMEKFLRSFGFVDPGKQSAH